jgi:low affinity Fe/Cu permease
VIIGDDEARARASLASPGNTGALRELPCMSPPKSKGWLTEIGVATSRPAAFAVFLVYGIAWITLGNGLEWHSFATLATWGMTLVIQRAEHRDTQAIHAKLDELLKVAGRHHVMKVDDEDAEEVESQREEIRRTG